jgi:hypothetical protein
MEDGVDLVLVQGPQHDFQVLQVPANHLSALQESLSDEPAAGDPITDETRDIAPQVEKRFHEP